MRKFWIMAKRRRSQKKEEEILVDVIEAKEAAQNFFEKNQLKVVGFVGILLLLIGGYLAYKFLYQQPREVTAMSQMFKAEYQFQQDSFVLALESPGGGYDGLLDIIDSYGGTKAANLAKYYAGISYLNLNRFEDAITYLQSHKAGGSVTSITKHGALGDAQSELGDFDAAISSYKKATSGEINDALTPYYLQKLGLLAHRQGDNATAQSAFKRIQDEFAQSTESADADKYLAMLQ